VCVCPRTCLCVHACVRMAVQGCVRHVHVRPARASASWLLLDGCVTAEMSLVFRRRSPQGSTHTLLLLAMLLRVATKSSFLIITHFAFHCLIVKLPCVAAWHT